jgi:hypothetical protein
LFRDGVLIALKTQKVQQALPQMMARQTTMKKTAMIAMIAHRTAMKEVATWRINSLILYPIP